MTAKVTPWFQANEAPVHIGEYEYRYESGYQFRAFWDGKRFLIHDKRHGMFWGLEIDDPKKLGKWRGRIKP